MGITGGLDVGDEREKNEDNAFLFSFFDPESLVSIPESSVLGRPSLLSAFDNVFFFYGTEPSSCCRFQQLQNAGLLQHL